MQRCTSMRFETKEESNLRRRREFMALSPSERFQSFIRLCWDLRKFASLVQRDRAKDNFIITRDSI